MDGKRLIRSLKLTNFLSFGPEGEEVELEPLNVLIGPNASGKSNFIEAIELLHAAPRDLAVAIRRGGGVAELVWKGGNPTEAAWVETTVAYSTGRLRYHLAFANIGHRHQVVSEGLRPEHPDGRVFAPPTYYEMRADSGAVANAMDVREREPPSAATWVERKIARDDLSLAQSALSQLRDPVAYPAMTYLGDRLVGMRLYREWDLGPDAAARKPCRTDDQKDFLLEDASNLGMILNDLQNRPDVWQNVLEKLRRFYERADDVTLSVLGNTIELRLHERGLGKPTPATRLSDGTLRYLCLLAILCHPDPPPLVVIEEPELGLHPDALGAVAELLLEASKRMQIIVTTHSDLLVSELGDVPEAVIVCERDDEGTHLRRLSKDRLKEWLDKHSLGELWLMGEIGGTT